MHRTAFTLLEMLIVLTIIAVLTTIAVQSLEPVGQKARVEATQKTLDNLQQALFNVTQSAGSTSTAGFVADVRRLPLSLSELSANIDAHPLWQGPYLLAPAGAATFADAWNRPFRVSFADGAGAAKPAFDALTDVIVLSSDGANVNNPADDVVRRIPASSLSAREIRVRVYAVDAQGNAIDISATTPTVTLAPVNMTGTAEATTIAGMDRVYTKTATPAELLVGTYAVSVAGFTAPAALSGTAYTPSVRVNVLPGSSHAVDLLVFRGAQSSSSSSTSTPPPDGE